jgi:RNA polymerase sigma-70 factor (ECF subfamily)
MTDPGRATSLTLMEQIKAHDQEAWRRLVDLYTPLVHHWCHRWGVRGEDANDVLQEVFHAVALGMANFRHERQGDSFRGWLRGITRNKLLDTFRRAGHQAQGGAEAYQRFLEVPRREREWNDLHGDDDDEEQERTGGVYHRALELVRGEFEERTWSAFWRAVVDGHAPADIAADLGVTPAAVRQAKSRILRRLKEVIGEPIQEAIPAPVAPRADRNQQISTAE